MGAQRTGRKVRGEGEAAELLAAWEESGERISDFCARRGVNWSSLAAYRTARDRRGRRPRLVELTASNDAEAVVQYRIVFGNGHALELVEGFDDDSVRRISAIIATC